MNKFIPFLALLLAPGLGLHGQESEFDLRTIRAEAADVLVEPAYEARPKYTLVLSGAHAEFRRWIVADGDSALYFDTNANGNLTEEGERFEPSGQMLMAQGDGYSYLNEFHLGSVDGHAVTFFVWVRDKGTPVAHEWRRRELEFRDSQGWVNATLSARPKSGTHLRTGVYLCDKPVEAQVSWVDGPLVFELSPPDNRAFTPGSRYELRAMIGIPGLETSGANLPAFLRREGMGTSRAAGPIARIQLGQVSQSMRLASQDGGEFFVGSFDVPDDSNAEQMEISIPDWKLGNDLIGGRSFSIPRRSQ